MAVLGALCQYATYCHCMPLTPHQYARARHISLLSLSTPPWSASPHDQSVTPGDCLTCPTLAWWPLTAAISPSLRDAVRVVLCPSSSLHNPPILSVNRCVFPSQADNCSMPICHSTNSGTDPLLVVAGVQGEAFAGLVWLCPCGNSPLVLHSAPVHVCGVSPKVDVFPSLIVL